MAYNPSKHTASNKPYGTRGKALDARSYFYDEGVSFRYRPFQNIAEVLAYLPTADDRRGSFEVIINTGGTIQSSGYITGGTNDAYWFKDGLADENLVLKIPEVDLSDYYTIEQTNELLSNNVNIKTNIETGGGSLDINWNDIDPDGNGTSTYAQRHGEGLPFITASYFDSDLNRNKIYNPTVSYEVDVNGDITMIYIQDIFEGLITII